MAMIIINGRELPDPAQYKVARSDLDSENTMRNAAGHLLRDRVREGVYRIEASWRVRKADYLAITAALSAARFKTEFFDPNSNTTFTTYMYASDRAGQLLSYTDEARPQDSLWELSCSLTEY